MKTTLAFLALILLLPAVVRADDDRQKPANEYCPVMEGQKVAPDLHVDYRGKRVWFCCESCVEDFNADPEAYLGKLPQFAADDARAKHPLGVLHPMAVHFPIALAMAALLAACLGLLFARRFFANAATFSSVLAGLSAIPAYLLGGQAEEARGRMAEGLRELVHEHEEWGEKALWVLLAVAAVQIVHRLMPDVRWLRFLAFAAIVAAAAAVGLTGWHGAEVTQGPGHLKPVLRLLGL